MTQILSSGELYPLAAQFIQRRILSKAQAWPRFDGGDVELAREEWGQGPAGSLLFTCPTDGSMSNPMGIVHGGVTASLVDACMGITCSVQAGAIPTPTVTMTVNYARPVPLDAEIRVRTHTVRMGSTSAQMTAEVFLPDRPDEALATATGVYAVRH